MTTAKSKRVTLTQVSGNESPIPMLEMSSSDATYFSDLNVVYNDLKLIDEQLAALGASKTTDKYSARDHALWTSIVVTYKRNFGSLGKNRFRLTEKDVASLKNADMLRVHRSTTSSVGDVTAHQASQATQDKVMVFLNPAPAKSVSSISYMNINSTEENPADRAVLRSLVQQLIAKIEKMIQKSQKELLEQAKAQPIEQFYPSEEE